MPLTQTQARTLVEAYKLTGDYAEPYSTSPTYESGRTEGAMKAAQRVLLDALVVAKVYGTDPIAAAAVDDLHASGTPALDRLAPHGE